MRFLNLMPGSYYISVWTSSFNEAHDVIENVTRLHVEPSDYYGTGRGVEARFGVIFVPYRWVLHPGTSAETVSSLTAAAPARNDVPAAPGRVAETGLAV